jgi:GR25 family glycosyltransferase involved in LPS biosynthesis
MSSWIQTNLPKRVQPTIPINEISNNSDVLEDDPVLEHIDAILYINLAHRTDRNEHILNEIHKICKDDSKIHRIDAIKHTNGALGCGLSHIKAMEYALIHNDWNTILLLEDDFTFRNNNSSKIIKDINFLLNNYPDMDVGLLSHNQLRSCNTSNDMIKKVIYSQTTSSYIIKKTYIDILLNNMKEAMMDMEKNGKQHKNCLDINWTKLQPIHNWYAIFPALGIQYNNYSDIENKVVSYNA